MTATWLAFRPSTPSAGPAPRPRYTTASLIIPFSSDLGVINLRDCEAWNLELWLRAARVHTHSPLVVFDGDTPREAWLVCASLFLALSARLIIRVAIYVKACMAVCMSVLSVSLARQCVSLSMPLVFIYLPVECLSICMSELPDMSFRLTYLAHCMNVCLCKCLSIYVCLPALM